MFPDLFTKAAALAESIVQGHALVDGCKRVAVMSNSYLLAQHGYRLSAPDAEREQAILDLTNHVISRDDYARWLRSRAKRKKLPTAKQYATYRLLREQWLNNPYRGERCWRDPQTGEWKTLAQAFEAQKKRVSNPLVKLVYKLLERLLIKS